MILFSIKEDINTMLQLYRQYKKRTSQKFLEIRDMQMLNWHLGTEIKLLYSSFIISADFVVYNEDVIDKNISV